ncbi:MAG: hypothetical protein AB1710_08430 [Pseudomonadota bacterium]
MAVQETIRADGVAPGKAMPAWAAAGVYLLVAIISLGYGFQYLFQGDAHEPYFHWVTLPFVAVMLSLSGFALSAWPSSGKFAPPGPVLGTMLMSISFLMTVFFYSSDLAPVPWPLVAGAVLAIAWYCHHRWGSRGSTLAFLACAFVLYAVMIARVPHNVGANMLEIIEAASHSFLAGETPYRYYEPIAKQPFGYSPGLWLPYSVFVGLGLDVRILNLICFLLIVLVFEKGLRHQGDGAGALSLTLYPFLLSPPVAQMIRHGHVWPYWIVLLLAMLMLLRQRYWVAAVFLGLALASRPPALFVVGPLAAWLYWQVGWRRTLRYAAISLLAYGAVVMPFALWTGKNFWVYSYLALGKLEVVLPQISVASWLEMVGLAGQLKFFQLSIVVFWTAAVFLRKKSGIDWFLFTAGIAYVWLVMFNAYVLRYVYFPGLFLMLMGLSIRLGHSDSAEMKVQQMRPAANTVM